MLIVLILLLFGGADCGRFETCKLDPLKSSPFCNTSLSIDDRVDYILQFFDFDEKIELMQTDNWEITFQKVKLSPFNWDQEGLHGLCSCNFTDYKVTSFPQVTNLGSTYDMDKVRQMGAAISDEGRALANILAIDLSFWAPNVNIYRDPRWGRGQETPGEDPYLTSEYAKAYITGLQYGDDPKYLKAISGCKHYTAYDLENWDAVPRYAFDAVVTKQDMAETFQPPFKAAVVDAGVRQIMCSYNAINGVPSCVNEGLLADTLRDSWGFDGNVVSDCGAIADEVVYHDYFYQPELAVTESVKAGCDLNCGWWYNEWGWYAHVLGQLTSEDLNTNLRRLFKNRMLLGEFDPWEDQKYRKIPTSVINSKKHQQLALDLARESMTLLKNLPSREGQRLALPLVNSSSLKQIAVIGPNSQATVTLQGDYYGPAPYLISPLDGIKSYFPNVVNSLGCDINSKKKDKFDEAIKLARESDLTILVMGLDQTIEGEGLDRYEISFPGVQEELIQKIAQDSQREGDLILVLINGGPIDISWERDSKDISAILWAGYPSQSGGQAIADVIFGAYNPAGKTTYTIYPSDYVNQVSFFDMGMRPSNLSTSNYSSPGRTYKFFNGDIVYPFGYGLSYTSFEYEWVEEDEGIVMGGKDDFKPRNISLLVKNTGSMKGDNVVLAFITNTFTQDAPMKKLFGFARVHDVEPGEVRRVDIEVNKFAFEYVNTEGERVVLPGDYLVKINEDDVISRMITIE